MSEEEQTKQPRGCYEPEQEWLGNAENGEP